MGTFATLRGFLPVVLFRPSTESIAGGVVYLDANLENEKTFTATVDTRIDPPVNPQFDGQRVRFRGVASGATRAITIGPGFAVGSAIGRGPFYLPTGQLFALAAEWSTATGSWFVTDVTSSAGATFPWDEEQVIYTTARAVGSGNIQVDGQRIATARTLTAVYHRLGTADASGTTTILVKRNGTQIASTSIVAPATTGSATGLTVALAAGDIVAVSVSAIGTTPGQRLTTQLAGNL